MAQRICGQRRLRKRHVTIFSDNQAAVRRVGQLGPGRGQHIACRLHDIATTQRQHGGSLQVEWVSGHCAVDGKEKADVLAKAGFNTDPARPETSLTDLLRCIKADSLPGKPSGIRYPSISKDTPQMRTGHGHFATYLQRIGFRNSDRCITCPSGPRETPQHLLFHCLWYAKARLIAAKKYRIPLHTKAFLYRDMAHKALAELVRDTRIGTRIERANKEEERAEALGEREGAVENDVNEDDGDVEEWDEEDEELVGMVQMPEPPEEVVGDAGEWLYREFGDTVGELQ
ncbi:Similar to hypothetical protein TSTA_098250 [Talaromyces stipitatus ATCC 10500]; acc. no. XP_002485806 [Pyronema omphalodes CBS 100304]|uniref:Uncharacterized protein n=1 Tax=Pyronema omphalodes (strain CBS 100304) TaxID=1076935 RepID=U4LLV1_PYROM|nr:Similar to hypothetical protein TSTA_098250 [Talaromyces stipitatus ATCC 10500]; acc. no. XP_002485806 [Pyronema omphalodes CBS 100304]